MTDDRVQIDAAGDAPELQVGDAHSDGPEKFGETWVNLWQIPTIIVSIALIAGGLYFTSRGAPAHDFSTALDQIERLVRTDQTELAATLLENRIAPYLDQAGAHDRGRYLSLSADVLARSLEREGAIDPETVGIVAERYRQAEESGFTLSPKQQERWALSLIDLGEVDAAKGRLEAIEAQALNADVTEQAKDSRHVVLRYLIEHSLAARTLPADEALAILADYRADPRVDFADEVWAIARQAETRLDDGRLREAIDRLQIDMRRVEPRIDGQVEHLGELYVVLARGYYEINEFDFALEQVRRSLELLDERNPVRAAANVVLGRILIAQTRYQDALDVFNRVVGEYDGTSAFAAGLLGRSEVHAILGDHEASQSDYRALADRLRQAQRGLRISREQVVASLVDRHDAALAMMRLSLALDYIEIAEELFDPDEMPDSALLRLASTHRALADEILAEVTGTETRAIESLKLFRVDPAIRQRAGDHYKQAADYWVAHAASVESAPTAEHSWLQSVWQAADNLDRAGYVDAAMTWFSKYLEDQTDDDPRSIECRFRLARCAQAVLNFESAAGLYEEIIRQMPTSQWATRSHVPLATCYIELGRLSEAEQQLLRVVNGLEPLDPAALDYRDALVALGTLYYNGGQWKRAIEELDKAAKYYPDHERSNEIRYRLADSYRGNAEEIARHTQEQGAVVGAESSRARRSAGHATSGRQRGLRVEPPDRRLNAPTTAPPPPSNIQDLLALRIEHLNLAIELFSEVIEESETMSEARIDPLRNDELRLAYLYRADCAFQLGDYRRAIDFYDDAARRYDDHPSSMVALVQIVNAFRLLGENDRARAAHNRALLQLQLLPQEALDDPEALLDRQAWRRWLEELPPGLLTQAGTESG